MKIYIKSSMVDDFSEIFRKTHPNITDEDLRKALDHPESFDDPNYARFLRESLAYYTTDPVIIKELANDKDKQVRHSVARNPATDLNVLMQLLQDDKSWWVRAGAITSIDDSSITDRYVNDPEDAVRIEVLRKTHDPNIFAILADDPSWYVREEVAERTRDPQILAKLAEDSDPDVSKIAKRRLGRKTKSASKNASLQINVGMNFDSIPVVQITSSSEADEFASEFEYVDSVPAANGLYAVKFNNEDVQIFKLANSLSNYKSLLKKDYQDYAKQELEEDGEANMLLFLNSYELTVDEEDCRSAAAYVNYALDYIQNSYVDGDSFSCINLLQASNKGIKVVLAGEDEVIVR